MTEFDFNQEIKPVEWLVDGLIPLGQIVMCFARSGQGKSYFCENLAVKIICEQPFLGRKVLGGNVLLIDQDTPTPTIKMRLVNFGQGNVPKYKLWLKSQEYLSFSNRSIVKCIQSYPDTRLVVIDTYSSVLGEFDPNSTVDSNHIFNMLKSECSSSDKTIWINHHFTQKGELDINELMFGDIFGKAMGNSAIIQRPDAFFVICGNVISNELKDVCIRAWGKRAYIAQKPFMAAFENNEFTYIGDLMGDSDECANDLRVLFYENPSEGFKVSEIYERIGKKHGMNKIYKYLSTMEKDNEVRMERGKSNQFKYFYNLNDGNKPHVLVKKWAVKLPEKEGVNDNEKSPEKPIM
jgi:hypothetical protein